MIDTSTGRERFCFGLGNLLACGSKQLALKISRKHCPGYLCLRRHLSMELTELDNSDIPGDWSWPEQQAAYALPLSQHGLDAAPTSFPAAVSSRLHDILLLDLSLNHITQIGSFRAFDALRRLDLSCNLLTAVTIEQLPYLVELNLAQNLISKLHLASLPQLKKLDISVNELCDQFPQLTLPSVTHLNISSNYFFSLPQFPNLQVLVADRNSIADLGLIPLWYQIQAVSLIANKIRSLESAARSLRRAPISLKVLNLWGNPISEHKAYRMTIVEAVDSLERFDERPLRPFMKQQMLVMKQEDYLAQMLARVTLGFNERFQSEQLRLRDYVEHLKRLERDAESALEKYRTEMESELQSTISLIQKKNPVRSDLKQNLGQNGVAAEGAGTTKIPELQAPQPFAPTDLIMKQSWPQQDFVWFQ